MPLKKFSPTKTDKAFWAEVRRYRRRMEASQRSLASLLKMSQASLSRKERLGGKVLSRQRVLTICHSLELSSNERELLLALGGWAFTEHFSTAVLFYLSPKRGVTNAFTKNEVIEILDQSLQVYYGRKF